jgi:hypothetical protein
MAVVPEWDRVSAFSFRSRRSEVGTSADSPFDHLLLTFQGRMPRARLLPPFQASDGSKRLSRLSERI